MAMRINSIMNYINLALNENQRGRVSISKKVEAIEAASDGLFIDLLNQFRESGFQVFPDKLAPFKKTGSLTFSAGAVSAPSDMEEAIAFETTVSAKNYEGEVARSDKDFISRDVHNLMNEDGTIKNPHSIIKSTIALTTGIGTLPQNFVRDKGSFLASGKTGIILDSEEFNERKNSVLVPPDADNPIAKIYDGKIEVFPTSVSSIDIPHYAFPTEKRAIIRVSGKLGSATINVRPVTVTSGIIYYVKTPAAFVWAYATAGNGRDISFDEGSSTEIEWGRNAISDLVNRALIYLGVKEQNEGAASIGLVKAKVNDSTTNIGTGK